MLHLALTTACLALSSGLAPAPRLSLAPRSAALRSSPIVLVKEDSEVEEECPSPVPVPLQLAALSELLLRRTRNGQRLFTKPHNEWTNETDPNKDRATTV